MPRPDPEGRVWEHKEDYPIRAAPPLVISSVRGSEVFVCNDSHGFKLEVKIPRNIHKLSKRKDLTVDDISCLLEDGTDIQCVGHLDPQNKIMRIDAVKVEYSWFWFQTSFFRL